MPRYPAGNRHVRSTKAAEVIEVSDDEAKAAPAAGAAAATNQKRNRSTDEASASLWSTGNKKPAYNSTIDLTASDEEEGQLVHAPTEAKYGLYELERGYRFQLSQEGLDKIENPKGWLSTSGIEFCLGILTGDPTDLENKWFLYNGEFYSQTLLGKKPGGLIQYDKMWEDTRPFSNRKFIVPIHAKNHWAVVMVDVEGKRIIMYDSLADKDRSTLVIREIKAYVEEKLRRKGVECNFDLDWSIDIEDNPKQMDGFNCGIYVYLRVRRLIQGTLMLDYESDLETYLENVRNNLVEWIKSCSTTK